MFRYKVVVSILTVCLAALLLSGCDSGGPDPKATVIKMFGAMERNDRAALTALLDLQELMRTSGDDYALQRDSAREWTSPEQILNDLTGDGVTKERWFSLQRIIGDTEINKDGESATVEVTFVNKEAGVAYLTKFGLHLVNGKWRIHSFKTFEEPPSTAS